MKNKILYLLIDRPDNISYASCVWKNKKEQFHRDYDLPAYIFHDGYTAWFKNDFHYKDK